MGDRGIIDNSSFDRITPMDCRLCYIFQVFHRRWIADYVTSSRSSIADGLQTMLHLPGLPSPMDCRLCYIFQVFHRRWIADYVTSSRSSIADGLQTMLHLPGCVLPSIQFPSFPSYCFGLDSPICVERKHINQM